jgi:hypothetical protein
VEAFVLVPPVHVKVLVYVADAVWVPATIKSAPLKTANESRAINRAGIVSVLAFDPINSSDEPFEMFGATRCAGMDFVVFTWGKIGGVMGGCDGLCSENLPHQGRCVNGNSLKKCYGSVTFQALPSGAR